MVNLPQAKVIFLTDEELEQIKTYQIPEPKNILKELGMFYLPIQGERPLSAKLFL